ncbi:MAG: hypothetical protein MPN21_08450 [Thermoanaerobaculia bacterium]|nr:hypothetical protein [Thermoanaerobaculia bacterium]
MAASLDGVVEIDQVRGTVVVSGWDRPKVEVTGRLGRDLDSVLLERRGERVLLRVHESLRGASADLSIRVPRGARLEIESMSLDLRVTGVEGGVDSNVVSGTQRLTGSGMDSGVVRLETVSGVLQVDGLLGELVLLAVSGPVGVDATVRQLRVDTVNGPQDLRLQGVRRAHVDSLNGPVALNLLGFSAPAVVRATTFNGTLDLGLGAGTPALIDAAAKHGRIDNQLGGDERRREMSGYQAALETRVGAQEDLEEPSAQVSVSTYRGDILLRPLR